MNLGVIVFSPTGGGAKLARYLETICPDILFLDFTKREIRADVESINRELKDIDLLFVISPTYSHSIPNVLKKTLKSIKYNGCLCPISTYGGVSPGGSIIDIIKSFNKSTVRIVGYGEFVCHHSYDFENVPSRPNSNDLALLANLYEKAIEMCLEGTKSISIKNKRNQLSYITRLFERFNVSVPKYTANACNNCLFCESVCPMRLINSNLETANENECIRCLACARVCLKNARIFRVRPYVLRYLRSHINYDQESIIG